MTNTATADTDQPTARPPLHVVRALARIEARRMLRHPALPLGLALSVFSAYSSHDLDWSGARYQSYIPAFGGLLLTISIAGATAASRDAIPLSEEAPVQSVQRTLARLMGGLPLVAGVAVLVAAGATWLRASGGLDLGDEPGRTLHAHYTLPELLQPVLLAVFAVALGVAVGRIVRPLLAAGIGLAVFWFAVAGTYWVFNSPAAMPFAVVQVQPNTVPVGPPATDPQSLPAEWLLTAPGEFQDYWGRLVVSPSMAAWHDAYLVALTLLALAVALPGRWRRPLAAAGLVLTVAAVLAQRAVQP